MALSASRLWPKDRLGQSTVAPSAAAPVVFLKTSAGFQVTYFARDLTDPRVLQWDERGRLLVSQTSAGSVVVLADEDHNGEREVRTLISGLTQPHGLAFYTDPTNHQTYLYIAERQQVARYPYDPATGQLTNRPQNIANLPKESAGHFTRTIAFGPNYRKHSLLLGYDQAKTLAPEKLYISVGSSCDVCLENTWKQAALLESDPGGTYTAEFAGGLRNAVFFTFHPQTKEIWATEMGRDNLGDNLPPDEVNVVRVADVDTKGGARRFGWPFCYGNKLTDKTFSAPAGARPDLPKDCSQTEAPVLEIPAHSAPLGLAFIKTTDWPSTWQDNLLVAYHGSWNRTEKTGYKIVRFQLDAQGKILAPQAEDFISGWLADNKILGRPVDLKFGPDHALYISDDYSGVIYRVAPAK